MGKRGPHFGAELFAKIKRSSAHGKQQGWPGPSAIQFARQVQQFRRAEVVLSGIDGGAGIGDRDEAHCSGAAIDGGVDKDCGVCRRNFEGKIGCPLLTGNGANAGVKGEVPGYPVGQMRADAIVAAEGVAAGEDEASAPVHHPRTNRSTVSPSAFNSETARGIWPKAWVEQLRQGSKVRTTASMRLSMPSVNLPSLT